jgi:hypothetical protein
VEREERNYIRKKDTEDINLAIMFKTFKIFCTKYHKIWWFMKHYLQHLMGSCWFFHHWSPHSVGFVFMLASFIFSKWYPGASMTMWSLIHTQRDYTSCQTLIKLNYWLSSQLDKSKRITGMGIVCTNYL